MTALMGLCSVIERRIKLEDTEPPHRRKAMNLYSKKDLTLLGFPLVLTVGAKQIPPPPPFDHGALDKLGTIMVELVNPAAMGIGR